MQPGVPETWPRRPLCGALPLLPFGYLVWPQQLKHLLDQHRSAISLPADHSWFWFWWHGVKLCWMPCQPDHGEFSPCVHLPLALDSPPSSHLSKYHPPRYLKFPGGTAIIESVRLLLNMVNWATGLTNKPSDKQSNLNSAWKRHGPVHLYALHCLSTFMPSKKQSSRISKSATNCDLKPWKRQPCTGGNRTLACYACEANN